MNNDFKWQDLSQFAVPADFRGRPIWYVQLWFAVQSTLFRMSPKFLNGWRIWLLRRFGAKIGRNVVIRPTVWVTYPWRLSIGDHAWIGDDVVLFSYDQITIGVNAVVSQRCYICTGGHDYSQIDFPLNCKPVVIGDEAWLATDVFVAPGKRVGPGVVVGARSSVFHDLPGPAQICVGSPAKPVKTRDGRPLSQISPLQIDAN